MSLRSSAFLVLALLAAACDVRVGDQGVSVGIVEGIARDEWTRTYTVPEGGRVEIENLNGQIDVFAAAGEQVEVRATREVRSRTDEAAQELLKQVSLAETTTPDGVRIAAGALGDAQFLERLRIAFRVNVPPGLRVALRNENGEMRLENVAGHFTAETTNGTIAGRGIAGALTASTVNGGLFVELFEVTADMQLRTVNGGVRLDIQPDVNATIEASAVNGGVVVADGFPLEAAERGRARVVGRINQGGPKIVVEVTNGGIVIGGTRGRGEAAGER